MFWIYYMHKSYTALSNTYLTLLNPTIFIIFFYTILRLKHRSARYPSEGLTQHSSLLSGFFHITPTQGFFKAMEFPQTKTKTYKAFVSLSSHCPSLILSIFTTLGPKSEKALIHSKVNLNLFSVVWDINLRLGRLHFAPICFLY